MIMDVCGGWELDTALTPVPLMCVMRPSALLTLLQVRLRLRIRQAGRNPSCRGQNFLSL